MTGTVGLPTLLAPCTGAVDSGTCEHEGPVDKKTLHPHPQACVVSHGDAQGAVVNVMAIDRKVEAAVLSKAAELADVSQVHCLHIG